MLSVRSVVTCRRRRRRASSWSTPSYPYHSLCLPVPDHVYELCLHQLAVEVSDGVLERVLKALRKK